jgi:hypothetical protein
MTWQSFHSRGETLRHVIAVADRRRDGRLPLDVPGVAERFRDELELLGALALRWHTRLSGRIEREQLREPDDLEGSVVRAWCATAQEMPGVLAILDAYRADPPDAATAQALATARAKEHAMLAMTAGRASGTDRAAARVGARIEERARAAYLAELAELAAPAVQGGTADRGEPGARRGQHGRLIDRIKAALAA